MRKFLSLLAVLVLLGSLAFSQSKLVSGRVTDQAGQPVPFATIRVKGTRIGASADAEGNYTIKADASQTLIVSGTGLTTQEYPLSKDASGNLVVTRMTSNLSEVVVTSLGIKKQARAIGYSTATVGNEKLNIAKPINVQAGLIGQVSGLQVSIVNNGVDPQIRVQLRGERHISSDNQPLYIVDGLQVRSDYIGTINPEDVESTTILKSASAAALYGSEATNGVIIITLKKGARNGKFSVNVNQTCTMEKLAYFPALQTTFSGYGGESGVFFPGTPYQFTATNPYTGFTNYIPFENQQYGPAFDGNPADGYIGIPDQNGNVQKVPFEPQSEDPRKQFFVTGFTSQTGVTISNGDSKNANLVSLQYVSVNGTTPDDQANRANVLVAGKRTYGKFSYEYDMDYGSKMTNTVGGDITQGAWPIYWTLLNTPANIPISSFKDWNTQSGPGSLNNYYNAYYINPYWQVANSRQILKENNFQGVVTANLQFNDLFRATYRIGGQVTNDVFQAYRNAATFSPWAQQAYGPPIYGTPLSGDISGALENRTTLFRRIQQDILLTFTKKFGDINATLVLGNTIWDRYSNQQITSVGNSVGDLPTTAASNPQNQTSGLILPNIYNQGFAYGIYNTGAPITSSNTTGNVQGITETRLIGYYADLTLGYNDYLFLHGTFRRDYSSLLAPGNNSYDVYDIDASWVFSDNINMLKNSPVFSFGRLRAAYSHTGQITLPPYATANTFTVPKPYPYGGLPTLALSNTYNNPANTPEATNEIEAGIDLAFLSSRLTFSAVYYNDKNYNQLFQVALSQSTGFGSAFVNAAQTTSHGWEFDVNYTAIRTTNWRWDVGGNFSDQTTIVDKLYGTGANATKQTGIGNLNEAIATDSGKSYAFPQMYVYDYVRDPATGKVIVDPTSGLPSTASNPTAVGRTTPQYILGLTTSLQYKQWSIQIVADYRGGYVFFNQAEKSLDFTGASAHTTEAGRQNFIFPNSEVMQGGKLVANNNTYVQDGNIGFWAYQLSNGQTQTPYVDNAAAWKIRTINLTYDFSKLIAGQNVLKGAKLSVICNNVAMFRPSQNNFTDPEFNADNSNGLGYNTFYQLPPSRTFSIVASLNF
jgi:TonB-linked SusC/RagA family outer membrane protein